MVCECIEKIEAKMKDEYGDNFTMSYCLAVGYGGHVTTWPALRVRYQGMKKDGTPSLRWKERSILPTYCPVCGKRYEKYDEVTP